MPPFVPLSPQHLVAVTAWATLTLVMTIHDRKRPENVRRRNAKALAAVLVVYYAIESIVRVTVLGMRVMDTLPFEMCSALFFIDAFALWTGNLIALEVMWYWTMAGPIHAFITPTPRAGYPNLNYFQYFAAHGLLIFSAVYGTIALMPAPRRGGVWRSLAALVAFIGIVAGVDLVTGENYVYLRHKPPSPTLVDALGPWPYYTLSGIGVALASFALWSVPWIIAGRLRKPVLPPEPRTPAIIQLLRFATQPFAFFDRCAAKLGDPFTVDMAMFGKFVLVSDPALVKQVFTGDPEVFHAGKANRDLEPFVGPRSLLLLDGAEHLRLRRLLLPPFHGERMRTYAEIMADRTRAALARVPKDEPFAMQPLTQTITLEIILRAVFGLEHGAAKDRMFEALTRYLEPPSPLLMFLPLVDLPLTPYRAFLRRRGAVDREIFALLETRRAERDTPHDDILGLLLSARDEAGAPLTDSELRDELMTLLIAGHETTATALTWTFERLLTHPDVLERLMAELAGARRPTHS